MPNTIEQQIKRIQADKRLGFMSHVVVGYPSLDETIERVNIMAKAGADFIELQIPFSDPIADGPTLALANQQAVAAGITIDDCLNTAAQLATSVEVPLIFVAYYNTVIHYGVERFVQASAEAGIGGFIIPDMPIVEEIYEHFYAFAAKAQLPVIQIVSPASTPERLEQIARTAIGFVYCVARFGVTGASEDLSTQLGEYLKRVRKYATLPIAVGFGISKPEHIQALRGKADIVVIGSALLNIPNGQLERSLKLLCASL